MGSVSSGCEGDELNASASTASNNHGTNDCPSASETETTSENRMDSSQLREMLLANINKNYSLAKSCSSASNSSRNVDDGNGMYKFKTNIQQRFTADLGHGYPASSSGADPSSGSDHQRSDEFPGIETIK